MLPLWHMGDHFCPFNLSHSSTDGMGVLPWHDTPRRWPETEMLRALTSMSADKLLVQCNYRGYLRSISIHFKFQIHSLQWRHNGRDSVSNHQPHDCLLNRLFRRRSKKTPKLRVTGFGAGNSPGTGEFPAQMASNAENVSIWWRHHEVCEFILL